MKKIKLDIQDTSEVIGQENLINQNIFYNKSIKISSMSFSHRSMAYVMFFYLF